MAALLMRCPYGIEQALPHAAPMILLDEIVDFNTDRIDTSLVIRRTSPFFRPQGMPVHVTLEYMAQTCAAMVGVEALLAGQQPRIGLLLGTRNFHAARHWMEEGKHLVVSASVVYRDEGIGVFDCDAVCGKEELAAAQVIVYQPPAGWDMRPKDG